MKVKNHRILRKNKRNINLSTCKSFTLLELLLAVAIITLVISTTTYAFINIVRTRVHAHHMSVASFMAQDKLEEFKAASYAGITDGSSTDGVYTRTWSYSGDYGTTSTGVITVEVTYPSTSTSMNSVTLKTLEGHTP